MTTASRPERRTGGARSFDRRDFVVLGGALAVVVAALLASEVAGMARVRPIAGAALILAACYACSSDRRAIHPRLVGWGLGLQLVFAMLVLKTESGQAIFRAIGDGMNRLLDFSYVGSAFVFGPLGDRQAWPRIMSKVLGDE